MIQYLGAIAGVLFVIATATQALKSIKDGHSDGVSHGLIWMLLLGLIFMLIYIYTVIGRDFILLSSHALQTVMWIIIARYKYRKCK